MGRLLILIGVVMLVLGFVIPISSSMGFLSNMGGLVQNVAREPTAAELCNTGETLEVTQGASSTTGTGSNRVTGRTTLYTCVSATGERRDVTGSVVEDIISDITGSTSGLGSFISGIGMTVALSVGGIGLIIFGAILATRDQRKPRLVQTFGPGYPSGSPIAGNDSPVVGAAPKQPYINYNDPNFAKPQDANSVVNFVRDQLDAAYRSGQISREDYDRAIEKLNRR